MRQYIQSLNGEVVPNIVVPELQFDVIGESNAFSQNDETDQDFTITGKQHDLPSNGAIPNAIHFNTDNTWKPFGIQMNYSPTTPNWGIEYRFAKMALETDKVTESIKLMKYSKGGTNLFSNWKAPDGPYTKGYILISGNAGDPVPDFLIWIQGLNDAVNDEYAAAYEANLRDWITYMFSTINPKFLVVSRASTLTIPAYSHRVPIIQAAQDKVSAEFDRVILHVPNPNLELNADGIHYSPIGMDDLAVGIFKSCKPYIGLL